ncbi:lipoyl(octanoyl) transferase LipB [Novosphingobium sp. PASSN1]|uniref:lipoyl(octanoyl) transferase LipB n=1 Tax=Novosphingobium sp. PASSN1 TaxID=2015561 RepID=UPI000BD10FA7|nr:lipoyl(octanoyl) transferase LipB [Novosphingobium sp. PASSN1]OYU34211.1 MAG: lipoate-protein ligase B [Novosphingobium sp. PASSN1]
MTLPLPDWRVEPGLLPYPQAVAAMEARAAGIRDGRMGEQIWLVEHPPLYTAGTSAAPAELLDPDRFPVFAAGRGGRHTYHGPGQRIAYVMLDLDRRGRDVRCYVAALEAWVIATLAAFDVAARIIPGKVGVWVESPAGPAKIAAIGVRVRRWVTLHGVSINIAPDLDHFAGIVPCGLSEPVTSLAQLGKNVDFATFDAALQHALPAMLARLTPCNA